MPRPKHGEEGVTAVHIVFHELITELARCGHEIVLQLIFNSTRTRGHLTESEQTHLKLLEDQNIAVLPPFYPHDYLAPAPKGFALFRRIKKLVRFARRVMGTEYFYPAIKLGNSLQPRISESKCDAILIIWSPEGVAATNRVASIPRIAYHGDVEFDPLEARLNDKALFFGRDSHENNNLVYRALKLPLERFSLSRYKIAHNMLMSKLDVIANVTATNADYYTGLGHPSSTYIRNIWSDSRLVRNGGSKAVSSIDSPNHTIKIIGHVGYLDRTGGTYGLRYLLVDLLPKLEEVMDGRDFQIDIIGAGEIVNSLRPFLDHPRVTMRGFVEDLDSELLAADMLLMLNNSGAYWAAYTRHIMAFSMGLCLVVHSNSQQAIPEIAHMENALMGSTPQEIAEMILLAGTDAPLNRRLRRGARETYEQYFAPARVAQALSDQIEDAVATNSRQPHGGP